MYKFTVQTYNAQHNVQVCCTVHTLFNIVQLICTLGLMYKSNVQAYSTQSNVQVYCTSVLCTA